MYYNTTSSSGKELSENKKKAKTQDEKILEFFKVSGKLSASLIFPLMNCPITSIRRSLNTLSKPSMKTVQLASGGEYSIVQPAKIRKTDIKVNGLYGRKEYLYSINPSCS